MATATFNPSITVSHRDSISIFFLVKKFIDWSKSQEENRLLWLGLALAIHGCVLTPIMLIVVMLAGNHVALFILVMASMGASLVTNLAAMPTKTTIPVFALSILVDLGIFITCVVIGLGQSNIF